MFQFPIDLGNALMQVQGYVHDRSGNKLATLIGKWDESMYFVMGDVAVKSRRYDPMSEAVILWRKNDPPECPTRYNLTSFAITLNELTPGLKVILNRFGNSYFLLIVSSL